MVHSRHRLHGPAEPCHNVFWVFSIRRAKDRRVARWYTVYGEYVAQVSHATHVFVCLDEGARGCHGLHEPFFEKLKNTTPKFQKKSEKNLSCR